MTLAWMKAPGGGATHAFRVDGAQQVVGSVDLASLCGVRRNVRWRPYAEATTAAPCLRCVARKARIEGKP